MPAAGPSPLQLREGPELQDTVWRPSRPSRVPGQAAGGSGGEAAWVWELPVGRVAGLGLRGSGAPALRAAGNGKPPQVPVPGSQDWLRKSR